VPAGSPAPCTVTSIVTGSPVPDPGVNVSHVSGVSHVPMHCTRPTFPTALRERDRLRRRIRGAGGLLEDEGRGGGHERRRSQAA
jgi:hypothetical protein